jgi:hypothetical protein
MFSASSGGMDLDPSTALSSSSSAHSLVQRLNQQSSDSLSVSSKGSRRSGLSGSSSISGTAFPSLAVARAANAFASEKPPKLQFYLQSMTQESIAEMSKLYMSMPEYWAFICCFEQAFSFDSCIFLLLVL